MKKHNMKIAISESQLDKILKDPDVIKEQAVGNNDQSLLQVLQNKINDTIDKKQKEMLDQTTINIVLEKGMVSVKIGEKTYPMQIMVKGVYATVIPPKSKVTFGGPPMSSLVPEIEKMAEYKNLLERHPEIKDQITSTNTVGTIYTDVQNQGTFKLTITRELFDRKDEKYAVPFGTEYPLGEFFERNRVVYKFKNGTFGTLESGGLMMDLSSVKLGFNVPIAPTKPATITVDTLVLQDMFNFNDDEFKNPDQVAQQIGTYVQEIKGYIQKYGQPFIDGYKSKNPMVLGYSSMDGDPNQKITGDYKPCAGAGSRQEYDMCLSRERSRKIAEELNKALPELGGAIKFKGMGETTKWGPGWTKEKPTIPEQTAPNRRYLVPSLIVVIKPGEKLQVQTEKPQVQNV